MKYSFDNYENLNIKNKDNIKTKKKLIYNKKVFFDAIFLQICILVFCFCLILFFDSFSFGKNFMKIFDGTFLEKKEKGIIVNLIKKQEENKEEFVFLDPLKTYEYSIDENNLITLKTETGSVIYSPVNGEIIKKNFYFEDPYLVIKSLDYEVYIIGYQGSFYKIGDKIKIGDKLAFCTNDYLKIIVKKDGKNIDIVGENLWLI